jgi:hypothetical protein
VRFINTIFNLLRFNKRNWRAVLLCVLAATVFWFFNALNNNYSANLNFPLTFEYDEESYVAVRPLPHHVRINVSGLGWDLFRRSLGLKVPPLRIPLENPSEVKKIVGASLPAFFSSQLDGLQINYVLTDTLHLMIDQRMTRKVWLAVKSPEQYLKTGFALTSEVLVQPDEVILEGPQSVVRALSDTVFITLPIRNADRSYADDVEVEDVGELVSITPPVVRVSFSVDRLTEVNDTVALRILNIPDNIRSAVVVKEVTCTYVVPATQINTIEPASVVAEIDLSGVGSGRHKIVPRLSGLPAFSRLVRIDTVDVSF